MAEEFPEVTLVTPTSGAVLILERVEPGVTPEYCVHGKTTCLWCDEWCWLGEHSYDVVIEGQASPMCRECAAELIPPDSKPVRNVHDGQH